MHATYQIHQFKTKGHRKYICDSCAIGIPNEIKELCDNVATSCVSSHRSENKSSEDLQIYLKKIKNLEEENRVMKKKIEELDKQQEVLRKVIKDQETTFKMKNESADKKESQRDTNESFKEGCEIMAKEKCILESIDKLLDKKLECVAENKKDDLLMFIAGKKVDIIMVTEMIPKQQKNVIPPSLLNINGYKLFCNFNINKENLGTSGIRGTAIYVRNEIVSCQVRIDNTQHADQVWVETPLKDSNKLLCGCTYRSPSGGIEDTIKSVKEILITFLNDFHKISQGNRKCPHPSTKPKNATHFNSWRL